MGAVDNNHLNTLKLFLGTFQRPPFNGIYAWGGDSCCAAGVPSKTSHRISIMPLMMVNIMLSYCYRNEGRQDLISGFINIKKSHLLNFHILTQCNVSPLYPSYTAQGVNGTPKNTQFFF